MSRDFPERTSIECVDGTILSAGIVRPPGEPRAVVLAGHAMMVNARSLDRPMGAGFASTLARHGFLVVAADLRGHGRSGTPASRGGTWSYDDLVFQDIPALVSHAAALAPGLPLFVAGQSLMGHVALAWLGQNPDAPIHAMVLLSANIWLRHGEPSFRNQLRRVRDLALSDVAMALFGRMPARRLRMGTDDEAAPYFRQLAGFCRDGRWASLDGVDFRAALTELHTPILAVVGKGDRHWCNLNSSRTFLAPVPRRLVTTWHVGRGDHGLDFDPGHMQVVTDARCAPLWGDIAEWMMGGVER